MDKETLHLLLYAVPVGIFLLICLWLGVSSLWEKTGPGKRGKARRDARTQSLAPMARRDAIARLDPNNGKDWDILAGIAKDTKDSSFAREAALEKLPYPKARLLYRTLAQDGFSPAILLLDAQQDSDLLLSLAKSGNKTVLEKRLGELDQSRLVEEILHSEDASLSAQEALMEQLEYPAAKELLRQIALGGDSVSVFAKALEKLPYPQERETLIRIAEQHPDMFCRSLALNKLPYPQERETLIRSAAQDPEALCRRTALEKLPYPQERRVFTDMALTEQDDSVLWLIARTLPFPEEQETYVKAVESACPFDVYAVGQLSCLRYPAAAVKRALIRTETHESGMLYSLSGSDPVGDRRFDDEATALKGAIALAQAPEYSEDILRFLCENIHRGIRPGEGKERVPSEEMNRRVTLAGWSAAALGRVLALRMQPDEIPSNLEAIRPAIDEYNTLAEVYAGDYQAEVERYNGQVREYNKSSIRLAVMRPVFDPDGSLRAKERLLNRGIGGFMLDNGDLPLAVLVQILRDSQSRIPRFVRQGAIMGLLDWLIAHRDHPEAAKLLETVVSVRSEMIRSDSALTFFEVRPPADFSGEDYAVLLADVLHCANPSLKYGDTAELLRIAQQEVPGCMDMLRVCPMRLIDPVNRQTLGFYQFRPYVHAMWTRYEPPLNEGKVLERYHEVDDRTLPLSSGLHLSLFRDPYAVIPTIFHEYQHFTGDRNEASVFLRTQLFSIRFYQKYRDANAKADGVFAQMTAMLGLPPEAEKREALNDIIRRCYGEQLSRKAAEQLADRELDGINERVRRINAEQTWDPSKVFPLLDGDGDTASRDLIRDIVVRFATVPKSVTEKEFRAIVKDAP